MATYRVDMTEVVNYSVTFDVDMTAAELGVEPDVLLATLREGDPEEQLLDWVIDNGFEGVTEREWSFDRLAD